MKANFFYVVAIIVIAAITLGVNYKKVKTVKLLLENVEALAWGEGPSDEDHRRDQAVNCPEEGKEAWDIRRVDSKSGNIICCEYARYMSLIYLRMFVDLVYLVCIHH